MPLQSRRLSNSCETCEWQRGRDTDLQTVPEYFDHVVLITAHRGGWSGIECLYSGELKQTYGGRLTLLEEVTEAIRRRKIVIGRLSGIGGVAVICLSSWIGLRMALAEQHSAGSPSAVGHSLNRIIDFVGPTGGELRRKLVEAAWRIVLLRDHNTVWLSWGRIARLACGMVGSFMFLRAGIGWRRVSHASLPGIVGPFVADRLGHDSKSLNCFCLELPFLDCGHGADPTIRRTPNWGGCAMGIVLSVFFGCGVVLLEQAHNFRRGIAGLETFIFGKTASMTVVDVRGLAALP